MPVVQSHRDVEVWGRAMDLAEQTYRLTRGFPKDELYRLTAQLTRAGASVPANIAEGNGRATRREYAHFASIARGSALEVETLLLLVIRLGYVTNEAAQPLLDLCDRVSRMLYSLHRKLNPPEP